MEFLTSASVSPSAGSQSRPGYTSFWLTSASVRRGQEMTSGRKAHPTAHFLCDLGPRPCSGRATVSASICNVPGIGLTFISTDSHPSGPHSFLSRGKALLSHCIVREAEPKRLSDLLKATQLADDGRSSEALWPGRPVCFPLRPVGTSLSATPQLKQYPK